MNPIPLALYIHIPWCVRKCPYCDFNSHESRHIPETDYISALLADLKHDQALAQGRAIQTVFIGGGTPSLFSADSYRHLLQAIHRIVPISGQAEITLEANPGTFEYRKFKGFQDAGINRLSVGVQSFSEHQLQALGRIHNRHEAIQAIATARDLGFERLNIDLMHGLPGQTVEAALADLQQAMDLQPSHLSWYQLTIEANTHFHKYPPLLPVEDTLADIQRRGQRVLSEYGLQQYEVSAYARQGQESRHNLNYWQFGDYLALGAGAHGKITLADSGKIVRYNKTRLPAHYLERNASRTAQSSAIATSELAFEFLLNALRLNAGFSKKLFEIRTGQSLASIEAPLQAAIDEELIERSGEQFRCSARGQLFLDDVVARFLG